MELRCQDEEYKADIRVESISPLNAEKLVPSRLRAANLVGLIKQNYHKQIPETVLLNSVSLFEAFVSDIAKVAYLAFP